jgi:hypothetical protein
MSRAITIALLFLCLNTFGQHQERTVFVYNIAFGGFTAGIGSVINKPKTVNWKQAFAKGFWQGSIGGFVNYSGKKMSYLINKKHEVLYAWPAKLLHAAGYSIIQNASACEPFLENWTMDLGLIKFDYSLRLKKLKARLLPTALVATIIATKYGKFDFSTSIKTGEIIFKSYDLLTLPTLSIDVSGVTFGRAIVYSYSPNSSYTKQRILSHELIHRFQYDEYQVFNSWLKPGYKKIETKSIGKIFSKYVYADIPYFFPPYYLYGVHIGNHYYKNFYEFEAERFSTNDFVPR